MNPIRQIIKKAIPAVVPERLFLSQGTGKLECTDLDSTFSTTDKRDRVNVAFTFDDGPHPEYTPQLLDILKEYHQRGTFFVIGEKAQQYPALIKRIVNEGHEIGNHTFTHPEPAQTSAQNFLDEIHQTDQVLKQILGFSPTLVRPPKGKLTIKKMLGLWIQRRTVVLWDTDPRDYLMTDITEMTKWSQNYIPTEGNFCLMHDNHPFAIEAVRRLSENQKYRIRSHTVSNWLAGKSDQTHMKQKAYA